MIKLQKHVSLPRKAWRYTFSGDCGILRHAFGSGEKRRNVNICCFVKACVM